MTESNSTTLRWLVLAGVLVLLVAAGTALFFNVGKWLVVQDPLVHADVIVILSGSLPERALQAARLYQGGYADQIWISPPISPADDLREMNIFYLGEDFYNEKVLLAKGVPLDAIHILERPSANTEEEVSQISNGLRANNFHQAIVVTSKPHTRRVRTIWRKLVRPDLHLVVRFATDDSFDGAHWWRRTHDGLDVLRETLGLLNAWSGFPLRPTRN